MAVLVSANTCSTAGDWARGMLGAGKGHYQEGDSVPQVPFTEESRQVPTTVELVYGVTRNGKYAFDYLTIDRTQAGTLCRGHLCCDDNLCDCAGSAVSGEGSREPLHDRRDDQRRRVRCGDIAGLAGTRLEPFEWSLHGPR